MAYKAPIHQGPSYVEEVLKTVDSLPQTLRNVYSQIKDLDTQLQQLEGEIDNNLGAHTKGVPIGGAEKAEQELRDAAQQIKAECLEISDKKIALAQNAADIMSSVIRGIDDKLMRFEAHLRKEGRWPVDAPPTKMTKASLASMQEAVPNAASRKANVLIHPPQGVRTGNTTVVEDAPVDPNEPRYCHCRQVSYGEMIACENAECPYEWFHFQCVGLTEIPSGPWRCADCKRLRRT